MLRSYPLTVNLFFTLCATAVVAAEIQTNFVHIQQAPAWLNEQMVEKATGPVQDFLQWHLHRIRVYVHKDPAAFQALHGAGPMIKAFFRRSDGTLHLGPEVNAENFQPIFSHELVHAIFYQKYKQAIPAWLEEGLANYLGKTTGVDYAWLAQQPFQDVRTLTHPTRDPSGLRHHYQTSTALIEMIVAKCSLYDLLQLSVGAKLETYLGTLCEIADINLAYRDWVKKKSAPKPVVKATPKSKPTRSSARP